MERPGSRLPPENVLEELRQAGNCGEFAGHERINGRRLLNPEDIERVTDALIECGTGEEFIKRVRTA